MRPAVKRYAAAAEYYAAEACYITELSNSKADPQASIARARVAPGVTTRWHRLKGTTERYVILEGRGRVEVGELAAHDVSPGDVVLIPAISSPSARRAFEPRITRTWKNRRALRGC